MSEYVLVGWLIVREDGTLCDGIETAVDALDRQLPHSREKAQAVADRYAANSRRGPYTVEPVYRLVPPAIPEGR